MLPREKKIASYHWRRKTTCSDHEPLQHEPFQNILEGGILSCLHWSLLFYEYVHSSPLLKETFIQISASVLKSHEKLYNIFYEDTEVSVSLCLLHDQPNPIMSSLSWNRIALTDRSSKRFEDGHLKLLHSDQSHCYTFTKASVMLFTMRNKCLSILILTEVE